MGCRLPHGDDHLEGVVDVEKDIHKMNPDDTEVEPSRENNNKGEELSVMNMFKYFCSMALLVFSVAIIMSLIFTKQTQLSQMAHPAIAFVLIWFLLLWLAMMEGGQASLVGLYPVNRDLYKDSHPTAFKSTYLAHKGDNMERFIVGRQFLVVLVVFLTNLSGAALPDSVVLGLPATLNSIFCGSGVAVIFVTVIIGQLTAQINATSCMLDVINNYFMLYFVTYVSLAIEFSGLLHSVYLVQVVFSKLSGKPITSNEPPRTALQTCFFWIRVLFSCTILGFAFAVVLRALFSNKTTMWDGFPSVVSVILFFVLMGFAGMMEGMQIAFLAVLKLPEEELSKYPIAKKNCDLTFKGTNLQAFLIGRQISVTACMFVVARIITLDVEPGQGENIFGVSDEFQETFLNSNILGAIITTIASSLVWRVIASSSPILFLSNPLIYVIIRLCLIIEASGLCSAAWVLAGIQKKVARFQPDEKYIGVVENVEDDLELQATIESTYSEVQEKPEGEQVASC